MIILTLSTERRLKGRKLAERDSSRSITALVFSGSIVISVILVNYLTCLVAIRVLSQGMNPTCCMIGFDSDTRWTGAEKDILPPLFFIHLSGANSRRRHLL